MGQLRTFFEALNRNMEDNFKVVTFGGSTYYLQQFFCSCAFFLQQRNTCTGLISTSTRGLKSSKHRDHMISMVPMSTGAPTALVPRLFSSLETLEIFLIFIGQLIQLTLLEFLEFYL